MDTYLIAGKQYFPFNVIYTTKHTMEMGRYLMIRILTGKHKTKKAETKQKRERVLIQGPLISTQFFQSLSVVCKLYQRGSWLQFSVKKCHDPYLLLNFYLKIQGSLKEYLYLNH